MKSTIILLALIMSISFCNAQAPTNGYKKTGKTDTIAIVLLVSPCETCPSTSVSGYAVRELMVYGGVKSPKAKKGAYADYIDLNAFLGSNKKPLSDTTIVWQAKVKQAPPVAKK